MIKTEIIRKRNSTRKSEVWNYFKFVEPNNGDDVNKSLVECEICLNRIKYSGNTTNLRTHFLRWHSNNRNINDDNNSDHNSSGKSIHCDDEYIEQYGSHCEEDNNKTHSLKKPKSIPDDNDDSVFKQKRSFVWQYYEDVDGIGRNKSAKCKFCVQRIKCWGNTTNLMSHLKIKHSILPFADASSEPDSLAKELCPTNNFIPTQNMSPGALIEPKEELLGDSSTHFAFLEEAADATTYNSEPASDRRNSNISEDNDNPTTSINIKIWQYFEYVPNQSQLAKCIFCQQELVFKGDTSRLQDHIKICKTQVSELQISEPEHQSNENESEAAILPEKELLLKEKQIKGKYSALPRFGRSLVWDFYEALDDQNGTNVAKCVICLKDIRYCGNTTNLRYHLNRWHGIYLGGMKPIPIKAKARTKTRQYFTLINKKNKQTRSGIWINFDVFRGDNNKILGRCKTCSTFIKSGQSTKSLTRHIKICHKKETRFEGDLDSGQRLNSIDSDIVKAQPSDTEKNIDGVDSDCSDNTGRINGVLTLSHSELGDRSVVCLETNISSTGEQKIKKTHSNTELVKEKTDRSKNCSYQRRQTSTAGNNNLCDIKDDCEIFGSLVEIQMRELKNEVSRKLLKRRILESILEITDSDGKLDGNKS